MARPRRISDAQIDAAARATFVAHGSSAPVALVAERLGVSHAALLQRAGSKEKLLLRALEPGVFPLADQFAGAPPAKGAGGWLERLLRELLAFHEAMLPGMMVLRAAGLGSAPSDGAQEPPTVLLRRLLKTWLRAATRMSSRRAGVVAEALLGALEARCFNAYLGGPSFVTGTPARFVHDLVAQLVPELTFNRRRRP